MSDKRKSERTTLTNDRFQIAPEGCALAMHWLKDHLNQD